MTAGALDRRIQFRRLTRSDDGYGQAETWADYGTPIFASKTDVRDSEKVAAGQVSATTMSRFLVRWSSFTAGLTAKDRLVCEGREFGLIGVKDIGRRQWRELTAVAESD